MTVLLDAAGRRRSPATMPGYHAGRPPGNDGMRYWEQLRPWLAVRSELPPGPLFCIIDGRTRGRAWSAAAVRTEFRRLAVRAGVRHRFAPHGSPYREPKACRPRVTAGGALVTVRPNR
jgi:hypothetical protein